MSLEYNKKNIPLAKNLRKNATPQERHLWYDFLSTYTPRFQRQKAIGNYIIDFYCASSKLAIELDGSGHYTPESMKKDDERTTMLQSHGIEVIRFCNLDIDKHFYEVCTVIDDAVKRRYRRGTPPV